MNFLKYWYNDGNNLDTWFLRTIPGSRDNKYSSDEICSILTATDGVTEEFVGGVYVKDGIVPICMI